VVACLDPQEPPGASPDVRLLVRACDLAAVPLALNLAAADLALRGLCHGRAAYLLFNGMTVSTLGGGFTQLVFQFRVTPGLVTYGVVIALLIGFVGGLFPAVRAARLPVTTALRAA
jgi:putative ABC transport system permease protein